MLAGPYFGLRPLAQWVTPPPNAGYIGGNKAEGGAALLTLTSAIDNTSIGLFSLRTNTTAEFNTGSGAGTLLLNTADENTGTGHRRCFQ